MIVKVPLTVNCSFFLCAPVHLVAMGAPARCSTRQRNASTIHQSFRKVSKPSIVPRTRKVVELEDAAPAALVDTTTEKKRKRDNSPGSLHGSKSIKKVRELFGL